MPFRGYFKKGDPRGPMFASLGSIWPTVPAYRYRIGSSDASGDWLFLKTTGILFEFAEAIDDFIHLWHTTDDLPEWICSVAFTREWVPVFQRVYWRLRIQTTYWSLPYQAQQIHGIKKSNTDLRLGNMATPFGPPGSPGIRLRAYQVEYDEENPPQGWPG